MTIAVVANPNRGTRSDAAAPMLAKLTSEQAESVMTFHRSIDGYQPTPLVSLPHLAAGLGVRGLLVKDESHRFGLNAFKALGGSYAIASHLAQRLGVGLDELPYQRLISDEIRSRLGEITFITTTDGNHGRGVAWTANKLRQNCVVHMPRGTTPERLRNIQALGARADITELVYDDTVRLSAREAEENGWVLVQDTSWPGYEDIPEKIIQGYMTMLGEAIEQMRDENLTPTHVFVQSGVGAMPTAVVGCIVNAYGTSDEGGPVIVVVEPNNAACIFETLRATDGKIHPAVGGLETIMAGLACGEPITIGIDLLAHYVDFVASIPDYVSAQGMRVLSNPRRLSPTEPVADGNGGRSADRRIISGESGAAAFGFAHEVLTDPALAGVKQQLSIDADSVLFFISTEGDTDRAGYDAVVNDGAYPKPSAPR